MELCILENVAKKSRSILTLMLAGKGKNGPDVVLEHFTGGCYVAKVIDDPQEINEDYNEVAAFEDTLVILDPAGLKKELHGKEFKVFRHKNDNYDCKILVIDEEQLTPTHAYLMFDGVSEDPAHVGERIQLTLFLKKDFSMRLGNESTEIDRQYEEVATFAKGVRISSDRRLIKKLKAEKIKIYCNEDDYIVQLIN